MDAVPHARRVLESLGGAENLASFTHCATRLRVSPHDLRRVDREALARLPGVVAVQVVSGQVQVVIGPDRVGAVHAAIESEIRRGGGADDGGGGSRSVGSREGPRGKGEEDSGEADASERPRRGRARLTGVVGVLVDVFTPLLPVFVAGGLLTAIHNVLAGPGVFGAAPVVELIPWSSGFVALVGLLGAAVFALLPVLLGFSATARFGGTPYLGAAMGAALVAAPLVAEGGSQPGIHLAPSTGWVIGGIDVLAIDYQGTVLPMIAIAAVLTRFEALFTTLFARVLRGSARLLLVPLSTLLCTGVVAFVGLGPVLRAAGELAAQGMEWLYATAGVAGGAIVGAAYPPLVVTGLHQGLIAIELGLIAEGGSFIFPIAATSNLAQAAACLAVWIVAARGSRLHALAASATLPAALGIAEPAMFAVTLRLRVPFVIAVAATTAAAATLAAFRVEAVTLGAAGVFGFASIAPASVGPFLLCLGLAVAISFTGTLVWARWRTARGRPLAPEGPEEPEGPVEAERPDGRAGSEGSEGPEEPEGPVEAARPAPGCRELAVLAPVAGTAVPVAELDDPAFASSSLGPAVAIRPADGVVVAPIAGVVTVVAPTRHAFGITAPGGAEVLVHIGIDTVGLGGAGFEALLSAGDPVAAGDALAHVDLEVIDAAGLDGVVLTIVTGADAATVGFTGVSGPVARGARIMTIAPEASQSPND